MIDPQDMSPRNEAEEPGRATLPGVALAVLPGPRAAAAEASGAFPLARTAAVDLMRNGKVMVAHAGLTARRLGLSPPPRSAALFDVLELFAFVRPGAFVAPSPSGLAAALNLAPPVGVAAFAQTLRPAAAVLLAELANPAYPARGEALVMARTLRRGGWAWGDLVVGALSDPPVSARLPAGTGLEVWSRLEPWEDGAPPGEPGSADISEDAARGRLAELLTRVGLDETRPAQADYAAAAAFAFSPRETEGEPRMMLAEAGTGVGKTLGYLAPASLWAQANGPSVWISTYTRALQRQIARETAAVYPDPDVRARKAVVRKGRENYLCLLNFEDAAKAAQLGDGDLVGAGLTARWISRTRDGDMTGGDYPAWLPGLAAAGYGRSIAPGVLVDRRGECVHAACPHYRVCFVEKAIRASRTAELVIANHALVLTQAAFDGARAARGAKADVETTRLRRIVFDEGHHLFDAADAAFSAVFSGQETAELRRWIRGPEGRRRGRGLEARLADLCSDHDGAQEALDQALKAAARLPGDGWSTRISPPVDLYDEPARPTGPIEGFLAAALSQLRARAETDTGAELGLECAARPATDLVREAAPEAAEALADLERPLLALSRALEDLLDQSASELAGSDRARIEGALRGLDRRARMQLPAWRAMLATLQDNTDDPRFVDGLSAVMSEGRIADVALTRHHVDPTEPLAAAVLRPAHGVLVTSATLSDPGHEAPFALAELRTGAARLDTAPHVLRIVSPFDYRNQARCVVVTDVKKSDARQVAAAMRELFLASHGGALGVFTAIRRLRAVHGLIAGPLADKGLALYAQHVDALETGALVDIFRAEEDSCLLGTDAVRDGVDVPGRALRLIAFDRTPWPRPDLLHKARRERFGGRSYDDSLARGRIAQAFGRLIRRADDKGVFVMLDPATPSRLFTSLPEGVDVQRMTLVEALELVTGFLGTG